MVGAFPFHSSTQSIYVPLRAKKLGVQYWHMLHCFCDPPSEMEEWTKFFNKKKVETDGYSIYFKLLFLILCPKVSRRYVKVFKIPPTSGRAASLKFFRRLEEALLVNDWAWQSCIF